MSEITEKQDYTDDICTHKDVDCNCMTAREKRMDRQIDHLTTSRANLKSALEKYGRHQDKCPINCPTILCSIEHICKCGFQQALEGE